MQLEYSGRRYPVAADNLVIGSDAASTVHLPEPGVLPRHAFVRRLREGMAVVEPAAPGATILLNGNPLGADPTPVMHGDKIRIGTQELAIRDPRREGQTTVLSVEIAEDEGAGGPASGAARPEPAAAIAEPVLGSSPHVVPPPAPPAEPVPEAAAPRLVSLQDGREYRVGPGPFVLGRDATCEVVVEAGEVSRRHAEIVIRPEGDCLVDLSSNGSFVNNARVREQRVLESGDIIRIGGEEFRYYPAEKPLPPPGADYRLADTMIGFKAMPRRTPAQPYLPPSEPALASFLVKRGDLQGQRLEIRTPVANIGRADYNDIRLPDTGVSASHAKVQLREGIWLLSDLGSTNGVTVDGERVRGELPLSPGAVVVIGQVRLVFEPRDEGAKKEPGTVVLEREALESARKANAGQPALPPRGTRPAAGVRRPPKTGSGMKWTVGLILAILAAVAALLLFTQR